MERITANIRFRNLLVDLERARRRQDQASRAVSSGQRISRPSEDPAGAAHAIRLRGDLSLLEQFGRNLEKTRSALSFADSALNAAVNLLHSAIEKGVAGADGTQPAQSRAILAAELKEIKEQMLAFANSSWDGGYIFAGSKVNAPPFVVDAAAPGGVRYQGDSRINELQLSRGIKIPVNLPGDQAFTAPSADVFAALQNLINALEADDGEQAKAAVTQVQAALAQVTGARAKIGANLSFVERLRSRLDDEKLSLTAHLSSVSDANIAESISQLIREETAERAILGIGARIGKMSLFDLIG